MEAGRIARGRKPETSAERRRYEICVALGGEGSRLPVEPQVNTRFERESDRGEWESRTRSTDGDVGA
jgi:hypothetical protein